MFWIELIIVLAIIFIGVRVGGTFLAMAGGIGMFIMTFILHVTPSDLPITVILIMIAVICAAATMQACGGLDYLVRIAEKILRKNPKMITVLAPVVAYIFTFMCGTGHIVYSLLPVINEIAIETGVRPERPISASIVSSQQAITACPISAATVGILAFMAEATNYTKVNIFTLLIVCVPATLIGTVIAAIAVIKKGKELADDPEFQARVEAGLIEDFSKKVKEEKKVSKEAKISVTIFLIAMVGIVLLGAVNDPVYSGSAGGFGGALLNGSVKDSKVTNLRKVNGMNYTGGFIGHLGKSGTVDLDNLGALGDLLSAGAGVMDVFGSHVDRCSVEGVNEGFTVHSNNTIDQKNKSEIAGGFTGYADLGRLSENKVTGLKQVTSGQIAGGFAGKTTFAYLANINLDSELVKGLVTVVNQILKALWLDELQKGQVIKIDLGIIEIDALYDGKLVSLNLLGLDIKVGLAEDKSLATIYIGDSKIEINCSESGTIDEESLKNEINISLIKANRTKIDKCTVTGIADGYDVYGGGAGNNANGTGQYGIAGGFVGWNNEGLLENNNMFFADVIRGAKDLTGPFTGKSSLNSNWEFNDVKGIEGNENYYRIYRNGDTAYEKLFGKSGKELQHNYETSDAWKNVYTIRHMTKDKVVKFTDLKDAMMSGSAGQIPVNVYQEDGAMAVLMNNTASSPTEPGGNEEAPDVQDPCKDLIELRLKKVWKRDEEKDRPNEVIFNITRSYEKDGKPVVDTNFNKEVILTKKDAQTSDIWEKVLTGAEYTAYHVGTDGKKYYYTYHVSEMKVDGYTTEITYKGDRQYSITVTNTKNWFDSLLPETGGMGKALLYALGVLLLCLVTATEYRKRKSTRSQSSYK